MHKTKILISHAIGMLSAPLRTDTSGSRVQICASALMAAYAPMDFKEVILSKSKAENAGSKRKRNPDRWK